LKKNKKIPRAEEIDRHNIKRERKEKKQKQMKNKFKENS
jgi:hypothetical protein